MSWIEDQQAANVRYKELMASESATIDERAEAYRQWLTILDANRDEVCTMMMELGVDPSIFIRWLETYRQALAIEHKSLAAEMDTAFYIAKLNPQLTEPLTVNDRDVMKSMFELEAFIDKPETGAAICDHVGEGIDVKKAFKRLTTNRLVKSKQGVGYWLTPFGIELAKRHSS